MEEKKDIIIHEANGLDTFVKIKGNPLEIGKILFAFVQFDKNTGKILHNIDIYMDVADALVFAEKVINGKMMEIAKEKFNPDEKYPTPFWESKLGGVNEENAKARGLRTDGKAISRNFNISIGAKKSNGSRNPFVITAIQRAGHTGTNKLIIPEKGVKPEITIRIPLMEKDDLMKIALCIRSHITAYNASLYMK